MPEAGDLAVEKYVFYRFDGEGWMLYHKNVPYKDFCVDVCRLCGDIQRVAEPMQFRCSWCGYRNTESDYD